MSQLLFHICQDPEEVDSNNASEEMDLLLRVGGSRHKEQAFFFHVRYVGCQQKYPRLEVGRLTSKDLT